jgi:DNA gyrase subunit B
MNPENRVLIQVRLEDAERADAIFSKLMGDEVSVRKNFIQTHAKDVSLEELDV